MRTLHLANTAARSECARCISITKRPAQCAHAASRQHSGPLRVRTLHLDNKAARSVCARCISPTQRPAQSAHAASRQHSGPLSVRTLHLANTAGHSVCARSRPLTARTPQSARARARTSCSWHHPNNISQSPMLRRHSGWMTIRRECLVYAAALSTLQGDGQSTRARNRISDSSFCRRARPRFRRALFF